MTAKTTDPDGLSHRALAMLRAIAEGRAEITVSQEPDLFVDGLPCSDQSAAHALAHAGLVVRSRAGAPGSRVPALLSEAGQNMVAPLSTAA